MIRRSARAPALLSVLLIGLLVAAMGPTNLTADQFEPVRTMIRKELAEGNVPSLAIAVAKDGQFVWQEGFGWANREQRIPANEHTLYSVASISKPITATGLMLLVDKKRIELDRPMNDYLASAKIQSAIGNIDDVTVRRVANHTSGLPLHYQFFYVDETHPVPPFDESLRRYGRLVAPPGEAYQYSNFGYGILGYLLERTSGETYADYLRKQVFLPLGMIHSADGVPTELESQQAVRYGSDQRPIPFYDFDHRAASSVFSSVHDLVRFGLLHVKRPLADQKAILPDAIIDEMQRPTADAGNGIKYGIGWQINEDEHGLRTVSHTGGMGGVRGRLVLVPTEGIVVAVLCNASSDLPLKVAKEAIGAIVPSYLEKYRAATAQKKESTPPANAFAATDDWRGIWEGEITTYRGNRRVQLDVEPDGDVKIRLDRQLQVLVNDVKLEQGYFQGVFASDIGTDDANRRPYRLALKLKLRGDRLNGAVTAMSLEGPKLGNALSHWIDLRRVVDGRGVTKLLGENTTAHAAEPQRDKLEPWRVADKFDFARHGKVEVRDGVLFLGQGQPATGVAWNGALPRDNYEVTLEAKRIEGSDFFCGLTFPVAKEYCTFIAGGWGGTIVGLSNINGMSAVENDTTNSVDFSPDKWYTFKLRVTPNRIEGWIDDRQVVDVDRADKRFSIWWEQEPMMPLGIASWNTKAALRNIQIRRLDSRFAN